MANNVTLLKILSIQDDGVLHLSAGKVKHLETDASKKQSMKRVKKGEMLNLSK